MKGRPFVFFQALIAGATAGAEPLAGTRSCARVAVHLSAAVTPLLATSPLLPRISIPSPASFPHTQPQPQTLSFFVFDIHAELNYSKGTFLLFLTNLLQSVG